LSNQYCRDPQCNLEARWSRKLEEGVPLPEYLCSHHWAQLKIDKPLYALGYSPCAFEPGELLSKPSSLPADDR